mmetsp:Transcript_27227/g.85737  ORF Transcript_27227/g.85737 Transcript_27227/m.85737 type:complete len:364 (+) Transcript_27227:1117-2208(+)
MLSPIGLLSGSWLSWLLLSWADLAIALPMAPEPLSSDDLRSVWMRAGFGKPRCGLGIELSSLIGLRSGSGLLVDVDLRVRLPNREANGFAPALAFALAAPISPPDDDRRTAELAFGVGLSELGIGSGSGLGLGVRSLGLRVRLANGLSAFFCGWRVRLPNGLVLVLARALASALAAIFAATSTDRVRLAKGFAFGGGLPPAGSGARLRPPNGFSPALRRFSPVALLTRRRPPKGLSDAGAPFCSDAGLLGLEFVSDVRRLPPQGFAAAAPLFLVRPPKGLGLGCGAGLPGYCPEPCMSFSTTAPWVGLSCSCVSLATPRTCRACGVDTLCTPSPSSRRLFWRRWRPPPSLLPPLPPMLSRCAP